MKCNNFQSARNDQALKLSQILTERDEVVDLEFEIQLAQQAGTQALQHVSEIVTLSQFGMGIEKLGN